MTSTSRSTARVMGHLLDRSADLAFENLRQSVDMLRFAANSSHSLLEGGLLPALEHMVSINQELTRQLAGALKGETDWVQAWRDTGDRLRAGIRFARLVDTLGKELYGSASFEGEEVLAENRFFRLVHIPAQPGAAAQPFALFHAGGLIPYGDRIFRLLPEINFYDRFRERGIAVYAMELRGDRGQVDVGAITLDVIIDTLARFSDTAFAHHGGHKLVLEGYCGHATQALAYLAARPEDAERKFSCLATFVGPIDGSQCDGLARAVQATPDRLLDANLTLWALFGGRVPGQSARLGLDLPLEAVFYKTPLGYFATGWNRTDLLKVRTVDDLTAAQRRDLAGAYWVSPDAAERFPVSVDVSRFTTALFKQGLGRDGQLPWRSGGQALSLATIAAKTGIRVLGFFGGRDEVVPDKTAYVLMTLLGDRYTHVVHPDAGHISYVLSPRLWQNDHPKALVPNPIDLIARTAS